MANAMTNGSLFSWVLDLFKKEEKESIVKDPIVVEASPQVNPNLSITFLNNTLDDKVTLALNTDVTKLLSNEGVRAMFLHGKPYTIFKPGMTFEVFSDRLVFGWGKDVDVYIYNRIGTDQTHERQDISSRHIQIQRDSVSRDWMLTVVSMRLDRTVLMELSPDGETLYEQPLQYNDVVPLKKRYYAIVLAGYCVIKWDGGIMTNHDRVRSHRGLSIFVDDTIAKKFKYVGQRADNWPVWKSGDRESVVPFSNREYKVLKAIMISENGAASVDELVQVLRPSESPTPTNTNEVHQVVRLLKTRLQENFGEEYEIGKAEGGGYTLVKRKL